MILIAALVLIVLALAPLVWVMTRDAQLRGRRDAALALHRAQLAELDRDLAEHRLLPPEHSQAVLEVQRRLLAADIAAESAPARQSRGLLGLTLVLAPLAAIALYLIGGMPGMPAFPLRMRHLREEAAAQEFERVTKALKEQIAKAEPNSDRARQGYIWLGNVDAQSGHMAEAAESWNRALSIRFEAVLAMEAAEAMTETAGHVTPESAALFHKALDAAPPNAPWRPMVEKRLADAPK